MRSACFALVVNRESCNFFLLIFWIPPGCKNVVHICAFRQQFILINADQNHALIDPTISRALFSFASHRRPNFSRHRPPPGQRDLVGARGRPGPPAGAPDVPDDPRLPRLRLRGVHHGRRVMTAPPGVWPPSREDAAPRRGMGEIPSEPRVSFFRRHSIWSPRFYLCST